MDEACKGLEIEFKRVVNDLEFCSHLFEKEFHCRPASNSIDVVSLIRRISALETSLQLTKQRSDDLVANRQRVTSMTASIMLQNHVRLSRLLTELADDSSSSSSSSTDADKENRAAHGCDEEEETKMEDFAEAHEELATVLRECTFFDANKLLMASTAFPPSEAPFVAPSSSSLPSSEQCTHACVPATSLPAPPARASAAHAHALVPPTPATATATATAAAAVSAPAFDQINPAHFEAIPVSTRGRCKLADVQAVLSRVVAHYTAHASAAGAAKKHGKALPLMVVLQSAPAVVLSDLGNGGLKVTGKTGDCVLGVLRVLGLVKVVAAGALGAHKAPSGANNKGSAFDASGAVAGPGLALSDHAIQALYAQLTRAAASAVNK